MMHPAFMTCFAGVRLGHTRAGGLNYSLGLMRWPCGAGATGCLLAGAAIGRGGYSYAGALGLLLGSSRWGATGADPGYAWVRERAACTRR